MLDFYLIRDDQSNNSYCKELIYIGGIEWKEFEDAQAAGIIESHCDYYRKFRWSSEQVEKKRMLLTKKLFLLSSLATIINRAFAANCGLAAFGD